MALPIIIDNKAFSVGGEGDYYLLDVVNDADGFKDVARTLFIENLGVGGGTDSIYFQLGDSNGKWTATKTVRKSKDFTFTFDNGIEFKTIKIWASDANSAFSMVITRGRLQGLT